MRVSEFYKLERTQPYLDFVDITLDTDVPVFVDPTAMRRLQSPWGQECRSLVQTFFQTVLDLISAGKGDEAVELLASLNERNEFHLGFSKHRSQGHGFGADSAGWVSTALTKSKASKTGLLQDLEDTVLMIPGIGADMLSDAVCNIIRGPLIRYTQDMCRYYDIPMLNDVDSGPIWNSSDEKWEETLVPLPVAGKYGKVILVPKLLVRQRIAYDSNSYYRNYLLPEMQREELRVNGALVQVLKNKNRRVTKKSLVEKYGADKLAVINETVKRPQILEQYRRVQRSNPRGPMSHEELADVEATKLPDFADLLKKIRALPTGKAHATEYENLVERLLTGLFYPSLCHPTKQHEIHNGRKRIDITYTNEAKRGFFSWVGTHYPAAMVFIECKNYSQDVENPEIDQLAGRFSPSRGKVGLLVCRKIDDKKLLMKRCIDTAKDHRGFILPLDDEDLQQLVDEYTANPQLLEFMHLRKLFQNLID